MEHHPSDETLVAYSAGTLNPVLALVVGVHVEMCPRCSETSLLGAEVGGILLEVADSAMHMPADGFERCWSSIETLPDIADIVDHPTTSPGVLERYLPEDLEKLKWRRITPTIAQFDVPGFREQSAWARLFRFQPGAVVPQHCHQQDEFSLVLQGSYTDHSGRFCTGDFSEADATYDHEPVVDSKDPCIALIAATGRIRFEKFVYRRLAKLLDF